MVAKSSYIQARIEPQLKTEGNKIIKKMGLSPSQVINALYAQITLTRGIPFELRVPSRVTLDAMNELENNNPKIYNNLDEMLDNL